MLKIVSREMPKQLLDMALEYAHRGWKVLPVIEDGKRPHPQLAKEGYKCATNNLEQIKAWWRKAPRANIGLSLAASGLVCLDADTYKPDCNFGELVEEHNLPDTLRQRSARGGLHLIYSCSADDKFPGGIGNSIDIKHKGYILLSPSIVNGDRYSWENERPVSPAPEWLKRSKSSGLSGQPTQSANNDWAEVLEPFDISKALSEASQGLNWYDNVLRSVASMVARGYSDAKVHFYTDQATLPGYELAETRKQVQGFINSARIKEFDAGPVGRLGDNLYHLGLTSDKKGEPLCNYLNVTKVLTEHPHWNATFAFNSFTQTTQVISPLPDERTILGLTFPRPISDADYTLVCIWLNKHGIHNVQKQIVVDAVKQSALINNINPVLDYLDACKLKYDHDQDNTKLDTWMEIYLGAKGCSEDQLKYIRAVSRISLIQAVARVREPGCKADSVVILEGEQGTGKSSAIRVLFGAEYFGDQLPPMHSKDASSYLRGKWCVELAELEYKRKAEVETIKAYISRTHENYRPAFGREEIVSPRTNVFFGTTNSNEYLVDETGNRRFLPVKTGSIDLIGLSEARDQLWAEAVEAFERGEAHWLDEELSRIASAEASRRMEQDPWVEAIYKKLCHLSEVSIGEAFEHCFAITDSKLISKEDTRRMGRTLLLANWAREGRFNSGSRRNQAKFVNLNEIEQEEDEHEDF